MQKERNFGLDLLRALAISLVICSHCTYLFYQESDNLFILLVRTMGAVGVDLFFVLSGFLIGGILLKQIDQLNTDFFHLRKFWMRRWLRTLPNYFFVLILNILLFFVYSKELPDSIGLYFVFLQNFSTPHPNFFTEAWSLSIEEYAYLILPLIMFIGFSLFKRQPKSVFLWTTISIIVAGFLLKIQFYIHSDIITYKDWSSGFRKVVIYRLDAIYIGFLLIYAMREFTRFFKKYKTGILILGILIFGIIHILIYTMQLQPQTDLSFFIFGYLLLISLSCALLFPYAVEIKRPGFFAKLIYFVSTRSYAMYLINFSVILLSIEYFIDMEAVSLPFKWILCLVYLILTIFLSNLIYVYFEQPILKYRNKTFRQS